MIRNRRNPFLIHLVLAAYLVAGAVNLKEVVLCFGDDGHVAVERATLAGSCETTAVPSAAVPTWVDHASLDHCGPCVDMALTAIDAASTRVLALRDAPAQSQRLTLHLPSLLLPLALPPTQRPAMFASPPAVVSLTSLQSVILLI